MNRLSEIPNYVIIISLLILTSSCHSDYVQLDYKLHHGACWNDQHTRIALIVSTCAYRPARGLARFPDGGVPEYLHEKVTLYVLDTAKHLLMEFVDFADLTDLIGYSRSSWKTRIAFTDSLLYCSVSPVSDWNMYLEHTSTSKEDSLTVYGLKDRFSRPFAIDEKTGEVKNVNSAVFNYVYRKEKEADFMTVHGLLSEIPLSALGLVIKDIYPKPDREYIEETIYLRNRSALSRRAVIEQIISQMSNEELRGLLKKMNEYMNSLEGQEKEEYKMHSKKVYEKIRKMMEDKGSRKHSYMENRTQILIRVM